MICGCMPLGLFLSGVASNEPSFLRQGSGCHAMRLLPACPTCLTRCHFAATALQLEAAPSAKNSSDAEVPKEKL